MKHCRLASCLFAVLLGLAAAAPAAAQITFKITVNTATANYRPPEATPETTFGYAGDQQLTFVFTTSTNISSNVDASWFGEDSNAWAASSATHDPIFASIGGTGLQGDGSYARGASDFLEYFGFDETNNWADTSSTFGLVAYTGLAEADIGIATPDDTPIAGIQVSALPMAFLDLLPKNGFDLVTFPGAYSNPYAFFTSFTGTHVFDWEADPADVGYLRLFGVNEGNVYENENFQFAEFQIDSIEISVAAVPEPATYAALFGVMALGLAAWRRRRGVL